MTLIFFKAFRTPSCVTKTGMWGNLFFSSFQFLIISNRNRISCSRFQTCKKPCRPCEKWCFLALRRNLRQSFPRSVIFGHGTNVQAYRPGDQSQGSLERSQMYNSNFPTDFSNKLVLLAAAALPVFLSKPRTHGSILAIKKIFQTASFILEIWYVCCKCTRSQIILWNLFHFFNGLCPL